MYLKRYFLFHVYLVFSCILKWLTFACMSYLCGWGVLVTFAVDKGNNLEWGKDTKEDTFYEKC